MCARVMTVTDLQTVISDGAAFSIVLFMKRKHKGRFADRDRRAEISLESIRDVSIM